MSTSNGHSAPPVVEHPDVATRAARGKASRATVPRSALGVYAPAADRLGPVEVLAAQEVTRVQELVPLRHERMLESSFAFYRGAAMIMARDLGTTTHTDLTVQLCGDAHLANFGGFASPERSLLFDVNDFDETNPGPFEWDVQRLVASFEVSARSRGFSDATRAALVGRAARAYREAMATFATQTNLETWYSRLDVDEILARWRADVNPDDVARLERSRERATKKDSTRALKKLTTVVDGERRIRSDPPIVERPEDLFPDLDPSEMRGWFLDTFRRYRHSLAPDRRTLLESYRFADIARKVVGVGSVGTRCWIVLLFGRDEADPLFLQVKEAEASVLEAFTHRSAYASHGQRVVEGQRLTQAAGDVLLGWTHAEGMDGTVREYYVRQLWDWKVSADLETMPESVYPIYAQMCGWTLARSHARTGDPIAISSYLGKGDGFDKAMGEFARSYADQNERDYETFAAAAKAGAIEVAPAPLPAAAPH